MEDQLITFETAKLSKAKRYNQKDCNEGFLFDGTESSDYIIDMMNGNGIARPTQSLLQRWLREVHIIDISISAAKGTGYYYTVYSYKECLDDSEIKYNTYEEALEVSLLEALNLII